MSGERCLHRLLFTSEGEPCGPLTAELRVATSAARNLHRERIGFPLERSPVFREEPCGLPLFHEGECRARCPARHPAGWALSGARCGLDYGHEGDHALDKAWHNQEPEEAPRAEA